MHAHLNEIGFHLNNLLLTYSTYPKYKYVTTYVQPVVCLRPQNRTNLVISWLCILTARKKDFASKLFSQSKTGTGVVQNSFDARLQKDALSMHNKSIPVTIELETWTDL